MKRIYSFKESPAFWIIDTNGILIKRDVKNVADAEMELSPKFGVAIDDNTRERAKQVIET
jgi:hypothetical protein